MYLCYLVSLQALVEPGQRYVLIWFHACLAGHVAIGNGVHGLIPTPLSSIPCKKDMNLLSQQCKNLLSQQCKNMLSQHHMDSLSPIMFL